jgi:replicative DNA helicase
MYEQGTHFDQKLEESVLSNLISGEFKYEEYFNILDPECFYISKHKFVYDRIGDMYKQNIPFSIHGLVHAIDNHKDSPFDRKQTFVYVANFPATSATSATFQNWCFLLREFWAQRLMVEISRPPSKGVDILVHTAELQTKLKKVTEIKVISDWTHISKVIPKVIQNIDDAASGKRKLFDTGVKDSKGRHVVFGDTDLVILAARPSVGKSVFMGKIAGVNAKKGYKVGIISLEMKSEGIVARTLSDESDIKFSDIKNGQLADDNQRLHVINTLGKMAHLPIYFSDTFNVTWLDIRTKALRLKNDVGLELLMIDYLQLIEEDDVKGKIRERQVAQISRGAKAFALEYGIPVVLLAQLGRDAAKDGTPKLHHLRESGAIEQDADIVYLLHRDWMAGVTEDANGQSTENNAQLIIAKSRDGITGKIEMCYDGSKMRFYMPDEFAVLPPSVYDNPAAGITRPVSGQWQGDNPHSKLKDGETWDNT